MHRKTASAGELRVPGDKSISHRALMFAAFTEGECKVQHLSPAGDVRSTARCLEKLGLKTTFSADGSECTVVSPGLNRLQAPNETLDAGNSGTTIRLLAGLAAGQPFAATFDGDSSLRGRPMGRVLNPLKTMGAQIAYDQKQDYPPFTITGGKLQGQHFRSARSVGTGTNSNFAGRSAS
ncbi:MAG: hypothetical protein U0105_15025 [Candidatus Obscuribacterales bacterium]